MDGVEHVWTADQLAEQALNEGARLEALSDAHTFGMRQIRETSKRAISFVQGIDRACRRQVTREDVSKSQRWDKKSFSADQDRRDASAASAASEEDDSGSDDEEDSNSSEEEEEEADAGVAHGAQLTDPEQVVQLIKGIEYCHNTAMSQRFAGERARSADEKLQAQTRVVIG